MVDDTSTLEPPSITLRDGSTARTGNATGRPTDGEHDRHASKSKLSSLVSRLKNSVSTWGFVDQGIVSVASFAAAAIVGRTCSPAELGIYTLAVKIFWLAAGIPNALVWMPYTSRAPRMPTKRRKLYLGSTSVHMAILAAVFCSVLLLLALVANVGWTEKAWLSSMSLALIPFAILMLLREHLRRMLIASMETGSLLAVDVPIAAAQLAILILLAASDHLTASSALLGMAAGGVWGLFWLANNRHRFLIQPRRIETHWAHNFRFGRWLLIVAIAWFVGETSYFWLVESFHGLDVMGQFSAAAITVTFFNPILLTIQNLARSILANDFALGGKTLLWEKTIRTSQLVAFGFGVLFVGLALVGGPIVQLVFGDKYADLHWIVASLCLGMYFHVLCTPVEAALTALQDGRTMLNAALLRLALILVAGIPLIAVYGPVGVGFAMATGSLGAGMLQWKFFHRSCVRAI